MLNIFISTNLEIIERESETDDEIEYNEKIYSRLTPAYYVWLRDRMKNYLKRAAEFATSEEIATAKERFAAAHRIALAAFGQDGLRFRQVNFEISSCGTKLMPSDSFAR